MTVGLRRAISFLPTEPIPPEIREKRRGEMTEKTSSSKPITTPPLSWKTRILNSIHSFVIDTSRRSNGTVNRLLFSFSDPKFPPNSKPVNGVTSSDVTIDPSRDLWFRLFLPAAPSDGGLPVIVFFHGGGFAFLSPASKVYDDVCRRIARKIPAAVVSVNYRLSPEHRFPAQYDDGVDVLRFLDSKGSNAGRVGGGEALETFFKIADLSSCFLAGDSAGGNIAHHVARRWATGEAPPEARLKLAGLVAIQAFFGGEDRTESEIRLEGAPLVKIERTDWLWKAFLPVGADRDHEAANVFGPRAGAVDLGEGFPPTVVIIGGFDPLQDWQRRYYEWLKEKGKEATLIEYPNAIHAFYVFPELKESGLLIEELRGFVKQHSTDSTDSSN